MLKISESQLAALLNPKQLSAFLALAAFLIAGVYPRSAHTAEYTPDSPEVKAMVARGVEFLDSRYDAPYGCGYAALVGYAVFKATDNPDHRCVQKGLAQAVEITNSVGGGGLEVLDEYVYAVSVSIQLMAAVDPIKYAPQMQKLLEYLQKRQRGDGAYGYKYKENVCQHR